MSRASEQISLKNQELEKRRQTIRKHRVELRDNALQYCRRPSTLGAAAVSGFLFGRLLGTLRSRHPRQHPLPSRLLDPLLQMIPVLLVERVRQAMIRRTQLMNHRESTAPSAKH